MALGGGEFDDAPPARMQRAAVELEALDQRQDLADAEALARRSRKEISTSNCPALANTAPSFMTAKCSARNTSGTPVTVMKTSPRGSRLRRGHDREALHPRLQRTQRVDLTDDHRCAEPGGPQGIATAGPAVSQHHDRLPGEQDVGRADDRRPTRIAPRRSGH